MSMFYVFCGFSYRSKVIIKGVYNIREVGYGIIKTKGVYSWYIRVESKFLYFWQLLWHSSFSIGSFLLMKFVNNLFFKDCDFRKPKVNQGLDLNLNLYLLTLLRSAQGSNNILILFKNSLFELSAFSSSIFFEKTLPVNRKIVQNKFRNFLCQIWTILSYKYQIVAWRINKNIRNY